MNNTNGNNKLIAEFMGIDEVDIDYAYNEYNELKYNICWNWLQPVINKCLQKELSKNITDTQNTGNINATYKAVIEFIKNQNK